MFNYAPKQLTVRFEPKTWCYSNLLQKPEEEPKEALWPQSGNKMGTIPHLLIYHLPHQPLATTTVFPVMAPISQGNATTSIKGIICRRILQLALILFPSLFYLVCFVYFMLIMLVVLPFTSYDVCLSNLNIFLDSVLKNNY